jgi:hypothetical protein
MRLALCLLLLAGCAATRADLRVVELEQRVQELEHRQQLGGSEAGPPIASLGTWVPVHNMRKTLLADLPGAPFNASSPVSLTGYASLSGTNAWTGSNSYSVATLHSAGAEIAQGQKLTFDGATAAKYLSSNGSVLALTGLGFNMPSFTSITWGSSSYGLVDGAANNSGLCLNNVGASGAGMSSVPVPGQIYKSVTATANSSTTETTLDSFSLGGNTMDKLARGIRIHVAGTFAANANTKTVKVKFGATDITGGAFTGAMNGGGYEVECIVRRVTSTTQTSSCRWGATSASAVNVQGKIASPAETLSGAITVAHTGQSGTASSDITSTEMYVEYLP